MITLSVNVTSPKSKHQVLFLVSGETIGEAFAQIPILAAQKGYGLGTGLGWINYRVRVDV